MVCGSNLPDWLKDILGLKISGFESGVDADGDLHIYYIRLENGTKIGIAKVFEDGRIIPVDRAERFKDGSILRFHFISPT